MVELDGIDPLKIQIADLVAARIEAGDYPPKTRIPSTAALADECSVSMRTVTDAIIILKERGLVRGVPGRGVFVLPKDE
jgi:DNA-binding GntR family transcriptional regulator